MGTSKSSDGAPSNVPMTPPWVPDPVPPPDGEDGDEGQDGPDDQAPDSTTDPPPQIAPRGRFGPARTSLGRFGGSGSTDDMRRGVGHYVRKGLGGSNSAAKRLGGTARTAGALYGALSSSATGQPPEPGSPLDPDRLARRSAQEVMDAVVEAVRPGDGTMDGEASRQAIKEGLSDLLDRYPEADLLNLEEEERLFVVERFVAQDVYNRLRLDVGKAVQDKAPNHSAALSRLRQIKDYVRETVSAQFRRLRAAAAAVTPRSVAQMATSAMRDAFAVFEDYIQ